MSQFSSTKLVRCRTILLGRFSKNSGEFVVLDSGPKYQNQIIQMQPKFGHHRYETDFRNVCPVILIMTKRITNLSYMAHHPAYKTNCALVGADIFLFTPPQNLLAQKQSLAQVSNDSIDFSWN